MALFGHAPDSNVAKHLYTGLEYKTGIKDKQDFRYPEFADSFLPSESKRGPSKVQAITKLLRRRSAYNPELSLNYGSQSMMVPEYKSAFKPYQSPNLIGGGRDAWHPWSNYAPPPPPPPPPPPRMAAPHVAPANQAVVQLAKAAVTPRSGNIDYSGFPAEFNTYWTRRAKRLRHLYPGGRRRFVRGLKFRRELPCPAIADPRFVVAGVPRMPPRLSVPTFDAGYLPRMPFREGNPFRSKRMRAIW